MKNLIFVALVFAASSAGAEEWKKTYSNELATEFVDLQSLKKEGTTVKATFRRDYADPEMRKSFDADEKPFPLARTMAVVIYECNGNEKTIEKTWDLSPDGKRRSPEKSYPKSANNDTWDAAAKKAVCQ